MRNSQVFAQNINFGHQKWLNFTRNIKYFPKWKLLSNLFSIFATEICYKKYGKQEFESLKGCNSRKERHQQVAFIATWYWSGHHIEVGNQYITAQLGNARQTFQSAGC